MIMPESAAKQCKKIQHVDKIQTSQHKSKQVNKNPNKSTKIQHKSRQKSYTA